MGRRGECWYCWYSSIRIVVCWSAKESQPRPHVTLWNAISEKMYSRSRHHMLRIVACYIAIWTTCGPVQCWHCKTITMALAMTMALRETDIMWKNLCDAETSPWTDYRSALLKPKAHREWNPLDFASDDLLGFNLIFWLLDCLIKEPAILSLPTYAMHIFGVSVTPWK